MTTERVIYGLYDPRDGRCRYIGSTTSPKQRRRARRGGLVGEWIRELRALGLRPTFRIIGRVPVGRSWWVVEQEYITRGFKRGAPLLNQRDAFAMRHLGRPLSENHKKSIGRSMLGNKNLLGHRHSAATRRKLRVSLKGKNTGKKRPDVAEFNRRTKAGVRLTKEHRTKIALSLLGNKNARHM